MKIESLKIKNFKTFRNTMWIFQISVCLHSYGKVSGIPSEWKKICWSNLWQHPIIPSENRCCHSSQYPKNLCRSFKRLSESGTVALDRCKDYCHGIIVRRAVPGLLINNGGKGEVWPIYGIQGWIFLKKQAQGSGKAFFSKLENSCNIQVRRIVIALEPQQL